MKKRAYNIVILSGVPKIGMNDAGLEFVECCFGTFIVTNLCMRLCSDILISHVWLLWHVLDVGTKDKNGD